MLSRNTLIIAILSVFLTLFTAEYAQSVTPQVAAGENYTAVVRPDGTLWAWGHNLFGELGDGTKSSRFSPVRIGSDADWAEVDAGDFHTVALKSDGTLWSWGYNYYGQLGDGTNTDRVSPVLVDPGTAWISVAAGSGHTAAVRSDGTLWTWGLNESGQLGDGTMVNRNNPARIGAASNWTSVVAGSDHTLALRADGTLWAWGKNWSGQLGAASTETCSFSTPCSTTPRQVGTDTDWASASAASGHSAAIKTDGSIWAWGYNGYGQLGDGTNIDRTTPVRIGTDTGWASVAAGDSHTVAVKSDGTAWVWGWNFYGQLGVAGVSDRNTPTRLGTDTDWASVAADSWGHSLALKADDTIWAWGLNKDGQLGDGTNVDRGAPVQIGTATDLLVDVDPNMGMYVWYVNTNRAKLQGLSPVLIAATDLVANRNNSAASAFNPAYGLNLVFFTNTWKTYSGSNVHPSTAGQTVSGFDYNAAPDLAASLTTLEIPASRVDTAGGAGSPTAAASREVSVYTPDTPAAGKDASIDTQVSPSVDETGLAYNISVIGTVLLDGVQLATIEDMETGQSRTYKAGESVAGAVVTTIHDDRVDFEKDGEKFTLMVRGMAGPAVASPANVTGEGTLSNQEAGGVPAADPVVNDTALED